MRLLVRVGGASWYSFARQIRRVVEDEIGMGGVVLTNGAVVEVVGEASVAVIAVVVVVGGVVVVGVSTHAVPVLEGEE